MEDFNENVEHSDQLWAKMTMQKKTEKKKKTIHKIDWQEIQLIPFDDEFLNE